VANLKRELPWLHYFTTIYIYICIHLVMVITYFPHIAEETRVTGSSFIHAELKVTARKRCKMYRGGGLCVCVCVCGVGGL